MLRARETPQSIRFSLLSPVGEAAQHPAALSPLVAPALVVDVHGPPSPVPAVMSLLLPGAACAAPDAGLGESEFLVLEITRFCPQLRICTCPKPCAFLYPWQSVQLLAWSAVLISCSHSALWSFSILPFHLFLKNFFKLRGN